jgi:hypothetical protein
MGSPHEIHNERGYRGRSPYFFGDLCHCPNRTRHRRRGQCGCCEQQSRRGWHTNTARHGTRHDQSGKYQRRTSGRPPAANGKPKPGAIKRNNPVNHAPKRALDSGQQWYGRPIHTPDATKGSERGPDHPAKRGGGLEAHQEHLQRLLADPPGRALIFTQSLNRMDAPLADDGTLMEGASLHPSRGP